MLILIYALVFFVPMCAMEKDKSDERSDNSMLVRHVSYEYGEVIRYLEKQIGREEKEIIMVFQEFNDVRLANALCKARKGSESKLGIPVTLILNDLPKNEKIIGTLSSIKIKILSKKWRMAVNLAFFKKSRLCLHGSWFPANPKEKILGTVSIEKSASAWEHFYRLYEICEKESKETLSSSSLGDGWAS
jgi:hypothetical protein